jgi:hypothetical protein
MHLAYGRTVRVRIAALDTAQLINNAIHQNLWKCRRSIPVKQ